MAKIQEIVELIRRLEQQGAPTRVIKAAQKQLDKAIKSLCFSSI